jgi:Tol biopolymer transport system component
VRRSIVLVSAVSLVLLLVACGGGPGPSASPPGGPTTPAASASAPASPSASNTESSVPTGLDGRIVFARQTGTDALMTFTVNPDGSDVRPLFSDGPSEMPRWSPDGTQIQIFCCDDGMAAHLIDPKAGDVLGLPSPDATLELHCGFAWSPDGERLACEAFGIDDPSLNGIYSVRASDGEGLTRITSIPEGDDIPGDYSPDGTQMVFARSEASEMPDEFVEAGLFVANVDGTGVHKISGPGPFIDIFAGSWSPNGGAVLFAARRTPADHKAIWVVNADGSGLHQLELPLPCGGPFSDLTSVGCYAPEWSPDGTMIAFTQSTPDGITENLFIVKADGSGLFQVTDDGGDDQADWGLPPSA